jgi:FMN phosphatase YigB (HAD superfamily)
VTAKAVLFDFGGTLDSDGLPWKDRFAAAWREEVGDVPPARFDPAFYAADDALVGAVPRDLSLEETVRRLAGNLSRELDADPEAGGRAGARFLRESAPRLRRARGFSELSRIGIASASSPTSTETWRPWCASSGLAPTCRSSWTRPSRVSRSRTRASSGSPSRPWMRGPRTPSFVGDSMPRDMEGARRLGMAHVWLAPGRDRACCPGDAVIERLDRLPEVIP